MKTERLYAGSVGSLGSKMPSPLFAVQLCFFPVFRKKEKPFPRHLPGKGLVFVFMEGLPINYSRFTSAKVLWFWAVVSCRKYTPSDNSFPETVASY